MNALELAACIDLDTLIDYGQVSTMLRQQQAEIEALKAELEKSAEVNRLLAEDIGYEK